MFGSFIQGKAGVSEKKEGEGDAEGEAEVAEKGTEEVAEEGTEEDAEEVAEEGAEKGATGTPSETTANCAGDTFDYKEGNPIVSITFSLSKENPFEVNVGTGVTSYKKSDKKAYPVLCEIKDFTSGSVKREPLKNKGCIEKNLPKVLAPILTQLNSLLLDQYSMYYDTKKYDDFVAAQSDFLKAPTQTPPEKGKDEGEGEGEEEQETPIVMEGKTKEQVDRSTKIQTLIQKLKDKSNGKTITSDEDAKLEEIAQKSGADLPTLNAFLTKHAEAVFPLHLLPLAYGNQIIFMTNDGIVSNGKQIFSYNDITETKIDSLGLSESGLTDEKYEEAKNRYNGISTDPWYLNDDVLKNGFKKGGNRRTLSKKLFKKRTTRRNRK